MNRDIIAATILVELMKQKSDKVGIDKQFMNDTYLMTESVRLADLLIEELSKPKE